MTARYLASPVQKKLMADIRNADRGKPDFFAVAPLVIDCRDDAGDFRRQVGARQRSDIADGAANGRLAYVSELARPAYDYARNKVAERFKALDGEARATVAAFLEGWRMETGRQPHQVRRSRPDAFGIDIILPESGARLSYDLPSMSGL